MGAVGACEAKTYFAELLDRVQEGERITITRHGMPVDGLTASNEETAQRAEEIVAGLREYGKGLRLRGLSVCKAIEEGLR